MNNYAVLEKQIQEFPDSPGVYFFKDAHDAVLYIGKATSLRSRARSYLGTDLRERRSSLIVQMIESAVSVSYRETDSALEALITEAALIKKHQPYFNTAEKDDKSYNYVIITSEEYPRIVTERGRSIAEKYDDNDIKYQFGPFTSGPALREAMKLVRKIFPYRERCNPGEPRACFNAQIGLCPGICDGRISPQEYGRTINHLRLFFLGKKKSLIKEINREMKAAAREQEFELAEKLKRTLFSLDHINDIALLKRDSFGDSSGEADFRIEAYDVSHLAGEHRVGVMVVVEDNQTNKDAYRKFKIRSQKKGDTDALEEILSRRIKHDDWQKPDLIVVDGAEAQLNVAKRVIGKIWPDVKVIGVVKDERHKPKELRGDTSVVQQYKNAIILANSESHRFAIAYHKNLRRKRLQ